MDLRPAAAFARKSTAAACPSGEDAAFRSRAARCAIKDAVASLADYRLQPHIDAPATPERVLWGCEQMRQAKAATSAVAAQELASS